ncbi:hypothetical protein ACFYU5_27610 [Nocardia aobensis]|uniref:DUF1508 domain-containing protein n=1 Tax=Nocardia aobensis TaxID=257277 RepID=A0ABW6PAQ6_9NOCA|nr:hypothetical protein [Nocardia sp. MDA0666]PSR58372.1 hypothetical protein C8258_31425 [Nocardia sp. MDA0666]
MAETGANADDEPFGPVRPSDAVDGWELAGDGTRWWLVKAFGEARGLVKPTTRTTCAWRVEAADGRMLREVSARSVAEAKAAAEEWIRRTIG